MDLCVLTHAQCEDLVRSIQVESYIVPFSMKSGSWGTRNGRGPTLSAMIPLSGELPLGESALRQGEDPLQPPSLGRRADRPAPPNAAVIILFPSLKTTPFCRRFQTQDSRACLVYGSL